MWHRVRLCCGSSQRLATLTRAVHVHLHVLGSGELWHALLHLLYVPACLRQLFAGTCCCRTCLLFATAWSVEWAFWLSGVAGRSATGSAAATAAAGEPLLTDETLEHVTALVAQHGSDVWWTAPIEQLLPPGLAHLAPTLVKGEDTMDVWFDSGSSWAGVVQARQQQGLRFPADLYLEGSDQHRGGGGGGWDGRSMAWWHAAWLERAACAARAVAERVCAAWSASVHMPTMAVLAALDGCT